MKTTFPFARLAALVAASWLTLSTAHAQVVTNIAYAKRDDNNDFFADDLFTTYEVQGRITSPNFATNRTEFFIQDTNDNIGILVIGASYLIDTNVFKMGYEVVVDGLITQTNGLRSINPNFSFLLGVTDPTEVLPTPVSDSITNLLAVAETNEGRLVEIPNVRISTGTWPAFGSSASITITDTTGQIVMRIDADVDLDGQLPPTNTFTLIGIFSQFDTTTNANSGYQIQPRFYSDVVQTVGAEPCFLTIFDSNSVFSIASGQTLSIDMLGQDRNATDTLVFSAPVAPGGSTLVDTDYRTARFAWTPSDGDRGTTSTVTLAVTDGITTSEASVLVYVLDEVQQNILLNEFQYDPDTTLGDANGDGVSDVDQDEFVEIVNNNASEVDISGWMVRVGTNVLFTFPPTVLTGKTAVVVFGGGTPVGLFGNATVYSASNWLGLVNTGSGGPINLVTDGGTQIFSLNYEPFVDNVNQSLTRNPDLTGAYIEHLTANPNKRYSPGTFASGAAFAGAGLSNTAPQVTAISDSFAHIGQVRVIDVSATDPESNGITLTMSNAPPTASFVDHTNGTGTLTYTGQLADAGSNFTIQIWGSDGSAAAAATFHLYVVSEPYSGVYINEVMLDPTNSALGHFDSNNDGVFNQNDDEYVEIVNGGTNAVDLTGFRIHDVTGVRHVFGNLVLPANGFVVVFGGGSIATFSNQPAYVASTGALGLNNSAPETVTLYTSQTQMMDQLDLPNGTITYWDGESLTRNPDFTGTFTNHTAANALLRGSPGRRLNGTLFLTNQPPFLFPLTNKFVSISNALQFAVTSLDADGDAITLVASNLPAGAAFGATNGIGLFTWTSASPTGTYAVTFNAADNDGAVAQTINITVSAAPVNGIFTGTVWINEFHYDNTGTDANELIEVAGPAGTDLSEYSIYLYDGNEQKLYLTAPVSNLTGTIDNEGCGIGAVAFYWPVNGIQNGNSDGFALVHSAGGITSVIQFLSYEGKITPTNGPAAGMTSTDVGVFEATSSGVGLTLQLIGVGTNYGQFAWTSPTNGSPDTLNAGQTISPCINNDVDGDGMPDAWESLYFAGATNADASADGDTDGYANLLEYIAFTDPTDSNSYFRVTGIANSGGRQIAFDSVTGRNYKVDYAPNLLDSAGWTNLQSNLPGTGTPLSFTDTNDVPARNYRIGVKLQ